ncbi:35842_t:CDS:1, partial [Gigaspora margarita]
ISHQNIALNTFYCYDLVFIDESSIASQNQLSSKSSLPVPDIKVTFPPIVDIEEL